MAELTAVVAKALELVGVNDTPERYVALLREHTSAVGVSQHLASHSRAKVIQRARSKQAGERFAALHEGLHARGVRELDRLTLFLQRVGEERAVLQMLSAEASHSVQGSEHRASKAPTPFPPPQGREGVESVKGEVQVESRASLSVESGWLMSRPYLCGAYLLPGVQDQMAGSLPIGGSDVLAALPVAQQEDLLVDDVLSVLVGCEGTHLRVASHASSAADGQLASSHALGSLALGSLPRVQLCLSGGGAAPEDGVARLDPSVAELVSRLLPVAEQYVHVYQFSHAQASQLSSGKVMHAFCAALRECLKEYTIGLCQLQQQQRTRGLRLQQLWYFMQPAVRTMATLHSLLQAVIGVDAAGAASSPQMHRGGALLRLLHVRWRSMASDVEGASLYQFLLSRTGAPFFDSLTAWVYTGLMRDPYGEFMVREAPQHLKEGLTTDFNCQYWQRRFTLVHEQVPAFLERHTEAVLACGKYLHVFRECGRPRQNPLSAKGTIAFTTDERALETQLKAAADWASSQLMDLLLKQEKLMARLASVKHYFLLDQGDFFVHFLDSAEEELVKPVSAIARGRLQTKLDLSLRQAAWNDPYRESLTCELLPYNLTNQLLRIINASSRSPAVAPAATEKPEKTPGLDAFAFDYEVGWPVSLLLSRNAIVKYQLIFRHLFHCKHVERQLSTCWLSQQATKGLGCTAAFSAAYGLRQRMLHFLQNIEHYMMLEVLEPNWHVLQLQLHKAHRLDELLAAHSDFLDSSLKQCMLRDPVLLRLLARLLTVCVVTADQARSLMEEVGNVLGATEIPRNGPARRDHLALVSATVEDVLVDGNYHANFVRLGSKFDEELKLLLDELRKQSHREWNLSHLCARLDYNNYWQTLHQSVATAQQ